MAQVELNKVVKKYGNTQVVHGIDLQIEDNEFLVLVGPSGCGKSTVLRMIAGLEAITDGEIRINGRPVNDVAPKDRDVAMVFQNYALYPHMTVFENIGFSLKMARERKEEIENKVRNAAQILELTPFLNRKPGELSGGQRQRVAMGRAIVRNPAVFLFDEPLSNLDAQLRTQMRMELKKLHLQMQTTTIYVTHDQVEAMTLADRIVILKEGFIQQVGTPIDVFERPINKFVASFIGNPPINILQGSISHDNTQISIQAGDLSLPLPRNPGLENGMRIEIGIRPDSIKTGHNLVNLPDAWKFDAEVVVSEILGGQSLLEFVLLGNSMIAELEGRICSRPGDTVQLGIDLDRLLFFDPQTGQALY